MQMSSDSFLADVAAISMRDGTRGCFGSGRLIAPGLILTARHVTEFRRGDNFVNMGWRVRLIRERRNGVWRDQAHLANVVWRSKDLSLDLALLQLEDVKPTPALQVIFGSYDQAEPIGIADATGFPEAVWDNAGNTRDYTVRGELRIATQNAPFAWTVGASDNPNDLRQW